MKALTPADIRQSFNGSQYLSADQIAHATGRQPGRAWQKKLGQALREIGIVPAQIRVNGKRIRAYYKDDFEADGKGRVRGSPKFLEKQRAKIEREIERLSTRRVLQELTRVAEGLEQDEPNAKERFRRLRSAISYELRMTEKEWAKR